jgi:hypothetical protein
MQSKKKTKPKQRVGQTWSLGEFSISRTIHLRHGDLIKKRQGIISKKQRREKILDAIMLVQYAYAIDLVFCLD